MDHILNVSQEQEYVFTGILLIKCGKQILLTARGHTATRALSTLLLLHNPKSSRKANRTLGKVLYTKATKQTNRKKQQQKSNKTKTPNENKTIHQVSLI